MCNLTKMVSTIKSWRNVGAPKDHKKMALVVTSLGKIKGKLSRSKLGSSYLSFKGIPYAQPPLGDLRFAKPQPPRAWNQTLDLSGNKESPACLQVNVLSPESKFMMGQEDCLYLNVFTPQLPGAGISICLPVIIWIHGGGFCVGSNDTRMYGPDYFLEHGVILVTINYRLGPLGFFALGSQSGNQGMHDQIAAMKWVQKHISVFGGDPNNVTIMGESAGAMSCMLHLVSPLSQGLFHKIMAFSGTASTPFLHQDRKPQHYGRAFAQYLVSKKNQGKNLTDDELLKKLKELPVKTIVSHTALFKDWDVQNPLHWTPCLDPHEGSAAFMPIPFTQAVLEGKFNKNIPILTGCTTEEGLVFSSQFHRYPRRWRMLFNNFTFWAPHLLFNRETELISTEDKKKSVTIKDKFFPMDSPDQVPPMHEGTHRTMEQLFATAVFQAPMVKDVKLLVDKGAKVFVYDFAYHGSMTLNEVFRLSIGKLFINFFGRHVGAKLYQNDLGVGHGDDLFYYFHCSPPGMPKSLKNSDDKQMSKVFMNFLTAFAEKGDPGSQNNIEWKSLEVNQEFQTMKLDKNLSYGPLPASKSKRIQFWLDEVDPNPLGSAWNDESVQKIHNVIAERRSSILDSQQLFT